MLGYDSNELKNVDTPIGFCEPERDGTDAFNFGTDDKKWVSLKQNIPETRMLALIRRLLFCGIEMSF